MEKIKVLILTVDCWNSNIATSSARTYSTLFSSMPEYEVYNIYIREELPNDPCCKRYFQISENRVIKSIFNRKIKTGEEVFVGEKITLDKQKSIEAQKNLYSRQRKRCYYLKRAARELLWLIGKWKSDRLNIFLNEIKPDVVIYSMEGYIHFNRLCNYAVTKTKASSIGYFWDDNFTYKQRPGNLGYMMFRFFQRRSLVRLANNTKAFWAITPKTKEEADRYFQINCEVLSKPTERACVVGYKNESENRIKRIFYAGNLAIGRADTIGILSNVLREINKDEIRITLDIYTSTEISNEMKSFGYGVTFHEAIPQSEVLELQKEMDILLFVEDILGKERKVARLSFSTKIPDYLSCGKCILAIGDFDTAPMEYFIKEDVALCAQNKEEIMRQLYKIIDYPEIMKSYGMKAYECAQRNHSKEKSRDMISKTITKALKL